MSAHGDELAVRGVGHAEKAAELLEAVHAQEDELERVRRDEPDEHLQLAAMGALGTMSRDRQWTVELAQAHATTALALLAGAEELG